MQLLIADLLLLLVIVTIVAIWSKVLNLLGGCSLLLILDQYALQFLLALILGINSPLRFYLVVVLIISLNAYFIDALVLILSRLLLLRRGNLILLGFNDAPLGALVLVSILFGVADILYLQLLVVYFFGVYSLNEPRLQTVPVWIVPIDARLPIVQLLAHESGVVSRRVSGDEATPVVLIRSFFHLG